MSANVDAAELAKFNSQAQTWWDLRGSFRPLHDLNPLRMAYIARGTKLGGQEVLDVGSGGGVPGVVLAILRPDLSVSLCESVGKKARSAATKSVAEKAVAARKSAAPVKKAAPAKKAAVAKKAVAKKPVAKKPVAKKPVAKKAVAKKPSR